MKDTYKELTEARKVLQLPQETNLNMIKSRYRALLKQWHPDTCPEDEAICHEMTQKIVTAYREIMAYCNQYSISFTHDAMRSYLSPEERWMEQFGNDPMWGNPRASQ